MYRILYKFQTIFKNGTAVNTNTFKKESKESNFMIQQTEHATFERHSEESVFPTFGRDLKKTLVLQHSALFTTDYTLIYSCGQKVNFKEGFSVKIIVSTIVGVSCLSYE